MLETSQDILNLVIAFCVLWFTIFVCWFIYYLIATIKKAHDLIGFSNKILSSVDELVTSLKNKLNSFKLLGNLIEKGLKVVDRQIQKNKKKTTKTKNKKK